MSRPAPSVLFVCIENSCRSQMAEGFARVIGLGRVNVYSVGSRPSGSVDPRTDSFMAEKGIDLASQRSKGLADLPPLRWDYLVTMGCGDECPFLPASHRVDWDLLDPKNMDDRGFRGVRDRIEALVRDLIAEATRPEASDVHKSARIVVLLNPAGSVLLVRYHDSRPIDPDKHEPQTYWVPPGGGVDEGESFEMAAIRELEEETGIELSEVGPQIWFRERHLMRHGELRRYQERYFLARAEPPRVLRNRTRENIEAIRWWTLDQLRASTETFFPEGFVELVAPVIVGNVPATPIDITRP